MSILRGLYLVDEVTVLGWSSLLLEYGFDIALGSLNVEGLTFLACRVLQVSQVQKLRFSGSAEVDWG